MNEKNSSGTLFIVATPIGNLSDMTYRAVETLKQADLIAAEDTRHSGKLLAHYCIQTRMVSCHEHNEEKKSRQLISKLKQGLDIALISDAGTPAVSDPGYRLVSRAAQEGIRIIPVPGCSAAVAGLSASGLPSDAFLFLGFLPRKQKKQEEAVHQIKDAAATLILYESPNRIISLITTLIRILGDRNACLAREITKLHEEFIRGTLSDIRETLEGKSAVKGECTLLVQGQTRSEQPDADQLEAVIRQALLEPGPEKQLSTAALSKEIAEQYRVPKKQVYDLILKFKDQV